MLSLSSVSGLLWRDHSFKRAGAPDELSECQAQNRGTHLWVFLEYCIFFIVRAFFFPFTREEDQGSWQGPCDFCISPSSRSLFSSFLREDHFSFLLALEVLACLRQEVSKGLFGITEKLSKLCFFFSLGFILLFPRKSVWPFLFFYLFFNFLSFEEEWTGSHKMWLYIVPLSQGQIMSLKQAPNACWTPAFPGRRTGLLLCDGLFILKLLIVASAPVPACSALSSTMISVVHGLLRNGPNQRKMHFEISQDLLQS